MRWHMLGCIAMLLAGISGSQVGDARGQATSLPSSGNGELLRVNQALIQERQKSQQLERQLAAVLKEVAFQAMALADSAAEKLELAYLRQSLEEERARAVALSQELDMVRRATEVRLAVGGTEGRMLKAHDRTDESQELERLRQALERSEAERESLAEALRRLTDPPSLQRQFVVVLGAAPETSAEAETRRFMAHARRLLQQHNILGARNMFERAAESGNADALFSLAETYDPNMLSEWGAVGTHGDIAKAEELYAKALAGGLQDADARLRALRH